ncbi:hypothetical protein KKI17_00310 [Patescibacteria group bacterium]|nr:hypothetical protein [Patescibacteria group bacterium]
MKWCIIVTEAPFLMEFLGKLSLSMLQQGDECVLVFGSKLAEYEKAQYFPEAARTVSKVDWCLEHYNQKREDYKDLTWRPLYANFARMEEWPWRYRASAQRLAQEYQFFEHLLETERPDAILFEPPSGVGAEVAYALSLKYGIPYLGITDSRISGRLDVFDSEYTDKRYLKTFRTVVPKDILQEELRFAARFIRDFLSHKRLPSYLGTGKIRFTLFGYISHYLGRFCETGGSLWRYFKERKKFKDTDFESETRFRTAIRSPARIALSQIRIARQKHFYRRLDPKDEFYVFPLHLQPETSTTVQAMYYSDQIAAIRNIAFQLPFPAKLYVKEHMSALGTKPGSFYKKLQGVPNVVLIAPDESMPELIRRSKGMIVLTGTAGMEAALTGKPTYILGNAFYEYHPLCRKVENFDELREFILADHKNGVSQENLKQVNLRFVVSYLRNTIPGSIVAAQAKQDSNEYQQIVRELRSIAQMRKRILRRKHS